MIEAWLLLHGDIFLMNTKKAIFKDILWEIFFLKILVREKINYKRAAKWFTFKRSFRLLKTNEMQI